MLLEKEGRLLHILHFFTIHPHTAFPNFLPQRGHSSSLGASSSISHDAGTFKGILVDHKTEVNHADEKAHTRQENCDVAD